MDAQTGKKGTKNRCKMGHPWSSNRVGLQRGKKGASGDQSVTRKCFHTANSYHTDWGGVNVFCFRKSSRPIYKKNSDQQKNTCKNTRIIFSVFLLYIIFQNKNKKSIIVAFLGIVFRYRF